jgi:hypothetical protein
LSHFNCFLVILPELGKCNSGSGIQNSAPASEKPPELRQNSGSGNSGAQHYFELHNEVANEGRNIQEKVM